jgi:hypothetical protein
MGSIRDRRLRIDRRPAATGHNGTLPTRSSRRYNCRSGSPKYDDEPACDDLGSAARSIHDPVIGTCRRGSTSSTNKVGVKALNQPVDEHPHPAADVAVGRVDQIKRIIRRLPILQHRPRSGARHYLPGYARCEQCTSGGSTYTPTVTYQYRFAGFRSPGARPAGSDESSGAGYLRRTCARCHRCPPPSVVHLWHRHGCGRGDV